MESFYMHCILFHRILKYPSSHDEHDPCSVYVFYHVIRCSHIRNWIFAVILFASLICTLLIFEVSSEIISKERLKFITTFEQYIDVFPTYKHCKLEFIEDLDPSSRLLKEKECDERSKLFSQALQEVQEHNAKHLGWTKG